MYYFAYGSNMNHIQMKKRCPDSRFITSGYIEEHTLVYDGKSTTWNNQAVANILLTGKRTDIVWGGIFEINEDDLTALDRSEGYNNTPKNYNRKEIKTNLGHTAWVYFRIGKAQGEPSKKYRDTVITGADNCGLPNDYIALL